jgi:hypothetical protein
MYASLAARKAVPKVDIRRERTNLPGSHPLVSIKEDVLLSWHEATVHMKDKAFLNDPQ